MISSTLRIGKPFHLGVVAGGVRQWAKSRGLSLHEGHQTAVFRMRRVASEAFAAGVRVLTLYALPNQPKSDADETADILSLYGGLLRTMSHSPDPGDPRLQVFGRRDRLPGAVLQDVRSAESVPRGPGAPLLRLGLDYNAREAVDEARAILDAAGAGCTFREAMALAVHEPEPVSPTDLVLVTGGLGSTERVLYWEPLYAPIRSLDVLWPDFDPDLLAGLIASVRGTPLRRSG